MGERELSRPLPVGPEREVSMQASSLRAASAVRMPAPAAPVRASRPPRSGMRFTRGLLIGSAASGTMWVLIGYAVFAAL